MSIRSRLMGKLSNNASSADGTDLDCSQLVRRVREHRALLAGCVGLFLLAGLAYLAVVPELHQATTIIEPQDSSADPEDRGKAVVGEMQLKTVEQNFRRISIYRRVVSRDEVRGALFFDEPDAAALQQGAERLARRTRIRWQRGTRLISITVVDEEPEMAKQLAGALVAEFALDQVEREREEHSLRLELLIKASGNLRDRLREHREIERVIHEKGQSGAASIVAHFEQQKAKGEDFWKGLDMDDLSTLTEERRRDAVLKYARGRAGILGLEIDNERQIMAELLGEIKRLELSMQLAGADIRVVEPAFVLSGTVGPGWVFVVLVSIFLGFAVGLVVIWCKNVCPGGK